MLKVYPNSENYAAVVVKLRTTYPLEKLDNLVGASFFGSQVLIGKDYPLEELYLYLPAGTVVSQGFLSKNNLFTESELNDDKTQKGYFSKNCRVRAVKFRGNTSTGVLLKLDSLKKLGVDPTKLVEGSEFNEINGIKFCEKYIVPVKGSANTPKGEKRIDKVISSKLFPEHFKTSHLLKEIDHLNLDDYIVLTIKLHGTSGRCGHNLVYRELTWKDKLAKWLGVSVSETDHKYIVGSRHGTKSVDFTKLDDKSHFYKIKEDEMDLWTHVCKDVFDGRLNQGEMVYFEIIGKTYQGGEIQKGYSYGFEKPAVFVYRISNINPQGVEVDLSFRQVRARCNELGIKYVPLVYEGTVNGYFVHTMRNLSHYHNDMTLEDVWPNFDAKWREYLETLLKDTYLDKPSQLDKSVVEEGICLRKETYPRPHIFKLKSPAFLIHETGLMDAGEVDMEEQQDG